MSSALLLYVPHVSAHYLKIHQAHPWCTSPVCAGIGRGVWQQKHRRGSRGATTDECMSMPVHMRGISNNIASYYILNILMISMPGARSSCMICCVGFGCFSCITLSVVLQAHFVPFTTHIPECLPPKYLRLQVLGVLQLCDGFVLSRPLSMRWGELWTSANIFIVSVREGSSPTPPTKPCSALSCVLNPCGPEA